MTRRKQTPFAAKKQRGRVYSHAMTRNHKVISRHTTKGCMRRRCAANRQIRRRATSSLRPILFFTCPTDRLIIAYRGKLTSLCGQEEAVCEGKKSVINAVAEVQVDRGVSRRLVGFGRSYRVQNCFLIPSFTHFFLFNQIFLGDFFFRRSFCCTLECFSYPLDARLPYVCSCVNFFNQVMPGSR